MDYRPGRTAYLSLLMLDKARQGQGLGAACCRLFEERMRNEGCEAVRIDVVSGYEGCALGFWQARGYRPMGENGPRNGAQSAPARAFWSSGLYLPIPKGEPRMDSV